MTISAEARAALADIGFYIAGAGRPVSAEQASVALQRIQDEFDMVDAVAVSEVTRLPRPLDVGVGFAMGALLVVTAMIGGRSHP